MKKSSIKTLRRLLCLGLIMTLMLSPAFSVFAADEITEEQSGEGSAVNESIIQETPPVQHSNSTESAESKSPEPASEESVKPAAEEAPGAAPIETVETDGNNEQAEPAEISEEASTTEQASSESSEGSAPDPSVTAPFTEVITKIASNSSSSGSIHIGDASFSSEDDESSHWSEGKGWKNVAGKYVAMVDYDGSEAEISAEGGVVTLAVAGVNRIGKLTGNCSYQISGTGIVLIDSIEIEDGNTITLHPDSAIYNEGSAAVFLKQGDSYVLINGGITGILDEVYELDNVNLVLPKDSSLTISVAAVRTETWDDEEGIKEDVTFYLTDLPPDAEYETHYNGRVEIAEYVGNVVLGKNSTLTINDGASVQMKKISTGFTSIEAELIVQGVLNVLGIVEGGFIDINNSGSVTGNGTIRSAEVELAAEGTISSDLLLDNSGLTIKGDGITISELNASGVSRIGVNTNNGPSYTNKYKIGDITISSEGSLEIVCNDHPYGDDLYSRLLEDSNLEINGKISGGPVYVLGGGVWYTGDQKDILPVVPDGYASRVFVDNIAAGFSLYPLNMTAEKAAELVKSDKIPFSRLTVYDSLISPDILGRTWFVHDRQILNIPETIDRVKDQEFTCESFLKHVGMTGESNPQMYFTAVEVIHSDMKRDRFYLGDTATFDLNDAITVRVLDCIGRGGQGGSAATHTNASFTGNGVIGSTGSGSVQAGNGKVIFGKASYTEPEPTPSPDPENNNTGNASTDSNGSSKITVSDNKESVIKTLRTNTGTTSVSSFSAGKLVVTVSPVVQNAEEQNKADPKCPQIYKLAVTNTGVPVTDLRGNPVKAAFPFTVPESWGDPAKIAYDSLYAVFADEDENLTAYSAEYDPEAGEVSFESEQTGDFVIVQFAYEDEPFTEDFYRALADLEEIRLFLAELREP